METFLYSVVLNLVSYFFLVQVFGGLVSGKYHGWWFQSASSCQAVPFVLA